MRREKVRAKITTKQETEECVCVYIKSKKRRYDDGLTLQFCVSFIGRSTEWRRYKQNFNNSRWLVLERNTIYQIPSLFFAVCIFCCFVSFFFFFMSEFDMHSQYYAMSSLMGKIGCIISEQDWSYRFLFSTAQMIYSICMLSTSRACNHNINDPYAKQMLEHQSPR